MSLDDRLQALEQRFAAIEDEWSRPEIAGDPDRQRELGREQASIEPVVAAYRRLKEVREQLASAHEAESDPELHDLARAEIEDATREQERLVQQIRVLVLARDPNDYRNGSVEIRAGAGGDEAALFAAQIFRMYRRYAERHRWQTEALTANETGIGGLREVIFEVRGHGAYSRLKYEGGVHRVQRVPETESSGRIHTSTATVAVLPEAEEVEIAIDEDKDLRVEVKRSSGPGGQSVNTTDSAVRITHIPTGLVVEIQDEKSQHKNRAKAMAVLRARLLDREQAKAHEAEAAVRRSMVGTGERSEKVRTYNYPQDRVSDHRIGVTFHNLPQILDGELDGMIDQLITTDEAERLSHLADGDKGPAVAGTR